MPDRKPIDSMAWATILLTLLVLVATVLVAPLPGRGSAAASTLPDRIIERYNPTPIHQPTIRSSSAQAGDAVERESALPSKEKDPDGDSVLDEARVSFEVPSCIRHAPDRDSLASRTIFSHFHRRC